MGVLYRPKRRIAALPPDLSGKTAWHGLSTVPGHNKYDLDYSIRQLLPTYVQGFNWGRQDLTAWAEQEYTKAQYQGIPLWLRKGAPEVLWAKLDKP